MPSPAREISPLSGTGTLALNAANSFTGATFANAGTLALGHVDALQNSTLTTATAGNVTFTVAGTNTYHLGGLAGNDTVALGANSIRSEPITRPPFSAAP